MPNLPEALEPASGWIALAGFALLVVFMFWLAKKATHAHKEHKKHSPSVKEAPLAHHPASGGGGHGHDDHHGGDHHKNPLWQTLLGWCFLIAAVVVLLRFLIIPFFVDKGFGEIPGQNSRAHEVSVSYRTSSSVTIDRPRAISCTNDTSVTTVIKPGERVNIHVPSLTRVDFSPSVDTGRISFCSYSRPGMCDPPGEEGIYLDEDTFTVTNLGTEDVYFRCWYSSL